MTLSFIKWDRCRFPGQLLLWIIGVLALAHAVGRPRPWEDALVLGLAAATTGAGRRTGAILASAVLLWLAQPLASLPTYLFAYVPCYALWRLGPASRLWGWEAFTLGFSSAWLVVPFMRDSVTSNGLLVQLYLCTLMGIQTIGLGVGIRLARSLPCFPAAVLAASAGTISEVLQCAFGCGWAHMSISLPAAPTPFAQWAALVGPFGVSWLLYLVNFLWLPDLRGAVKWRWLPTGAAVALGGIGWAGGLALQDSVEARPLAFSALIVQSHSNAVGAVDKAGFSRRLPALDGLTRAGLENGSPVDLVIWPEGCLLVSEWAERFNASRVPGGAPPITPHASEAFGRPSLAQSVDLGGFQKWLLPEYGVPCLVGATVEIRPGKRHNSACLLRLDGTISRHDKIQLIPVVETLPRWLDEDLFRDPDSPVACSGFTPGDDAPILEFQTRDRRPARIVTSVCYESFFPWLPQYRKRDNVDAVVHLTSEEWARTGPSYATYEVWACQYRAIETRKWQLTCSTTGNSAVIDPRGRIRASTKGKAGVLRTSDLFESPSANRQP